MPDLTAKRTLVKSPPELWEELSEVEGLTKHFGAFGEIKITKLEPEHTVAWEGEHGSGTVSIEPSGWGTKVTLHAELPESTEQEADPEGGEPEAPEAEPESGEPEAAKPEAAKPEAAKPEAAKPEPVEPAAEQPETERPEETPPGPAAEQPETERPEATAPGPEPEPNVSKPAATTTEPDSTVTEAEPGVIEPVLADEPVLVETISLPQDKPEPKRRGFWGWLFRTRTATPPSAPDPASMEPDAMPSVTDPDPVVAESDPERVAVEAVPPLLVAMEQKGEAEVQAVAVETENRPDVEAEKAADAEPEEPPDVEAEKAADAEAEEAPDAEAEEAPDAEPEERRQAEVEPIEVSGETSAAEEPPDAVSAWLDPERARLVLDEALDALGAAHHRPFSRG